MGLFDFLSPKPDHPLGRMAEARKVAADLGRREPREAVDEAMAWLESLTAASGFRMAELVERLLLIENAAVPQVRRLARDYLALEASSAAANTLWDVAYRFWTLLANAHMSCLERYQRPNSTVKLSKDRAAHLYGATLNAWASIQKWQQYRYRRLPDSYWEAAGKIYLTACERGLEKRRFELYSGYGQTTVEAEFLKILLFHVAATDTLPRMEIELGERLIAHFLPLFALSREMKPGSAYWIEAGSAQPPSRLVRIPDARPNQLFFNGTPAQEARDKLAQQIRTSGTIPPEVILGGQYPVESVVRVLDHLAMCWSPKPPVRDHVRRPIQAPLAVIHGFHEAMQTIAYAASEERTRIPDLELWSVSDVSLGGLAMHGTLGRNPWPCIGMMVTMKPDGNGNWLVGAVRRFSRNPDTDPDDGDAILAADPNYASLGIETLSRAPAAVVGDANGMPIDLIILDMPVVGEYCRLAVPPNSVEQTIPVKFILNGQSARMMPRETLETGPDYWIVNFFVQSFF